MEENQWNVKLRDQRRRSRGALDLRIFCFTILLSLGAFLFLLFSLMVFRESFRPILIVPRISSSSAMAMSARDSRSNNNGGSHPPLKLYDQVVFPDHVLLIIHQNRVPTLNTHQLSCLYEHKLEVPSEILTLPVLSIDRDDESNLQIARCPLPPTSYSHPRLTSMANKPEGERSDDGDEERSVKLSEEVSPPHWETLVYEAMTDGDSVVVFAKGLNLRPDRASDPAQFLCVFGWNLSKPKFIFTTKAITAAQEVIRCSLPLSIKTKPSKSEGITVSIKTQTRGILASVAKLKNQNKHRREKPTYKHTMCVCTMLWNQAQFLKEWIMYHAELGVSRWFIYDNNSDDGIEEVLGPLRQAYNVTRRTWPWLKTQEAGFSHCAVQAQRECKWVGFMDVDEFFYLPSTSHSEGPPLIGILNEQAKEVGEVRTSCHSFGPSGHRRAPSKGVTVGYTCRLGSPERHKSIVRPRALDRALINVVHHFHLKPGFVFVDLPRGVAVINHYKYQVWDVFKAKFYRRVATYVADWHDKEREGSKDRAPGLGTEAVEPPNWAQQFCEVLDTGLRDYVMGRFMDTETRLLPWE
ncbi:glycosyltransferase family 92 protein RCOM_0530710 [Amborella trichopoda]|uniref:Glycosyltransferase family 92 protein n=1 Tax=Amborella trichopoda TaxID=13333 RepID=U5D7A5_AMBTC|nr:glycosyltransferase family 92 protein RCOM_0530710 [Amborella trichopoda]ERN18349.1 hypothetical protein AMTR_s00055p00200940 [Amborella trichopoda]|eukprot:XP_006856882.1 glycosyltransferase family 92 protein RCOM_0530710 [Amborella trichopoda]